VKRIIGPIMALAALPGYGCTDTAHPAPQPEAPVYVSSDVDATDWSIDTKNLEHANVRHDVDDALRRGEKRPMGVMGIVLVVPGIDSTTLRSMSGGIRVIPHTGDSMSSAEEMRFQDIAYDYAEKYNRILVTKMPHPSSAPARR
jgi:hypothetical protein